MLTSAENEMLTRVSAGQPAGELLRRYWLPVGVACELSAENPTQPVRILGETLVLFRDKRGRVGLLDDRCSHRGASLATVAWKSEASLARITVGYTTQREIAWKRRQNLPRASFI